MPRVQTSSVTLGNTGERWMPDQVGHDGTGLQSPRISISRISSAASCLPPSIRPPGRCACRGSRAASPRRPIRHSRAGSPAGKPSKVARAAGIGVERGLELGRSLGSGLGAFFGRGREAAGPCRRHRRTISLRSSSSGGRSAIEARRPNCPIASRSDPVSPSTSLACQKPKVACALNAAIPASSRPL